MHLQLYLAYLSICYYRMNMGRIPLSVICSPVGKVINKTVTLGTLP